MSNALRTMPQTLPRTSPAVADCLNRYGNAVQFAETFNPDRQERFSVDRDRVFGGSAPTLATLCQAYGDNPARGWVKAQLVNLSEFAGCQGKITVEQMRTLAQIIIATYPYIKATELMLFCWQMKAGKYGKFYGAVDPMSIAVGLRQFDQERRDDLARIEAQRYKAKIAADDEIHKPAVDNLRAKMYYYGVDALTVVRNEDLFDGSLTPEQAKESLAKRNKAAESVN